MNGDNTDSQKLNKIISEIQALQEVVARFRQLRLDATEFACLKCIVTFKAGKQTQTCLFSSPSSATSLIQPPHSPGWPLQKEVTVSKGVEMQSGPISIAVGTYVFSCWLSNFQRGAFLIYSSCAAYHGFLVSFPVPTHSGSELRSFRNAAAIAALQDEAQLTLNSYIHTRWILFALNVSLRKSLPLWMCDQAVINQFKHCD